MRRPGSYTKSQLAKDLGMTSKRLTKELWILLPELIEKFPTYSKNCQILHPKIYMYILEQLGAYEPEEIREIRRRFYNNFGD